MALIRCPGKRSYVDRVCGQYPADTERLSVEFFEDNRMKRSDIVHIHQMSLHLASIFLDMSKDIWPIVHSWMQRIFLKQFDGSLTASKSGFTNGVSQMDGPTEAMHPDQWGIH
jgi:hypothetical protein